MSESFAKAIKAAPPPYDARAAAIGWERWSAALDELASPDRAAALAFAKGEGAHALLSGVFGNSPFLTRLSVREAAWLAHSASQDANTSLAELGARLAVTVGAGESHAEAMKALRIARGRAALLIALADLGGVFDLAAVTGALTRFADAALGAALARLIGAAAARGELGTSDPAASGFIVLAMGKYGAFELNYSSDIDLIVLYDAEKMPLKAGAAPGPLAVRLTQALASLLQQRTGDGYAFRVDLRLRPDGSASPVALASEAALLYYESAGQNWERAALIKARACGGDIAAGEAFLGALAPYIWRKHLDFAAIEDIHSIKRQIQAHKGRGDIAIAGHNIKLGRGGIREIEFFAQTQQLILGGREPELRVRGTCEALARLAEAGHIDAGVRDELTAAYGFLRGLEHRLQMIEDEQTHSLPKAQDEIDRVARLCGFGDTPAFEAALTHHLARVQAHYAQLFEASESLASQAGSLVFTGVEDDPETLATLARLGFKRGREISRTIRLWHHGHIRATRSARAREGLTRLVPIMLDTLSHAADPDAAFLELARFIEALPTGVQLFALLIANPELLTLLTDLFALAPRLSRVLAAQPAILDTLIGPRREEGAPQLLFERGLAQARSLEDALDAARIFARERQFAVAVDVLENGLDGGAAGEAFTRTAETVTRALFALAEEEMARRHGRIADGAWAALGLGKLGGREMTATSDLDLVFVYEFDPAHEMSDGARPLAAGEYFARAGQRLISLLTVPTREGKLYEVDMRLRPSGRAGPVAVTLDRLKTYHETQAWTFEHMALTRARFICGAPSLGAKAEAVIRSVLTAPRDLAKLSADALDMRARLASAKPVTDPWSLKQVRGGLIDLEYVAQVLQLALASRASEALCVSTLGAFENLRRLALLPAAQGGELVEIARFYGHLSQVMQICFDEERAPEGAVAVRTRLAALLGEPSYEALEARLIAAEAQTLALFEKYVVNLTEQRMKS